ncbi:zinc-ribbon domain-containing protein [Devosia naphthalenivorans]|uniref:zinc-ribbon domain-containing protein n=1 Tax=Devosia naphthalenivorans TaxID=2082392 RepID=UPI000D39D108|nr:zinc-ribbon domain-containing protein [Devosia naphthalenivorans]
MIIACPHCQTKYQVTYEAIGSAGRKVQCAHCQQAWQQAPVEQDDALAENKAMFEAIVEDGLDEALKAEEQAVAAELARYIADQENRQKSASAAKIDPAVVRSRQRAFSRRQDAIAASQPLARLRRAVRVGLALLLCAIAGLAYFGRVQIVEQYPEMAGVYAAVGLGVNIAGLDFTDVTTQRTLRNGKDTLMVSAQIVGLNAAPSPVPPIVVTLLDGAAESIYAWSIAPAIADLMAGERATFDTQLAMPPGDARRVRLTFDEADSARPNSRVQPVAIETVNAASADITTPPEHH